MTDSVYDQADAELQEALMENETIELLLPEGFVGAAITPVPEECLFDDGALEEDWPIEPDREAALEAIVGKSSTSRMTPVDLRLLDLAIANLPDGVAPSSDLWTRTTIDHSKELLAEMETFASIPEHIREILGDDAKALQIAANHVEATEFDALRSRANDLHAEVDALGDSLQLVNTAAKETFGLIDPTVTDGLVIARSVLNARSAASFTMALDQLSPFIPDATEADRLIELRIDACLKSKALFDSDHISLLHHSVAALGGLSRAVNGNEKLLPEALHGLDIPYFAPVADDTKRRLRAFLIAHEAFFAEAEKYGDWRKIGPAFLSHLVLVRNLRHFAQSRNVDPHRFTLTERNQFDALREFAHTAVYMKFVQSLTHVADRKPETSLSGQIDLLGRVRHGFDILRRYSSHALEQQYDGVKDKHDAVAALVKAMSSPRSSLGTNAELATHVRWLEQAWSLPVDKDGVERLIAAQGEALQTVPDEGRDRDEATFDGEGKPSGATSPASERDVMELTPAGLFLRGLPLTERQDWHVIGSGISIDQELLENCELIASDYAPTPEFTSNFTTLDWIDFTILALLLEESGNGDPERQRTLEQLSDLAPTIRQYWDRTITDLPN